MPHASSTSQHDVLPLLGRLVALAVVSALLLASCDVQADPAPDASAAPSGSVGVVVAATAGPRASGEIGVGPCPSIASVQERLTSLRAVELRLPNRVALDIELAELQAAYGELRQADLGTLEEELVSPLKRLGYRLAELELAVEDFRTNSRPQRAAPHVQGDAETLADALAAFAILARC